MGEASPGQTLSIQWVDYPNACTNAKFANIPAIGHSSVRQHPGQSAQIGLKQITKKCSIKITMQGGGVFQDNGKCPLKYEVACGDECPPGYLKCDSLKYPGYCCISCKETASKINNLTSKARCCNG